jgi:hypothetical protein
MSLAIYAAPFENYSNDINEENIIDKKKNAHNRTQKKYSKENYNSEKVNSVLQTLQNNPDDTDDNLMGDFNPPPKPQSIGSEKKNVTEQMQTNSNMLGSQPAPSYNNDNLDLNNLNDNYNNKQSVEKYYKNVIPNYNSTQDKYLNNYNKQYYKSTDTNGSQIETTNNILMQKLNYMIHLLEEQQDEKTNNVTEEVVLYSFLGIFIIFICDSFARAGKYVR